MVAQINRVGTEIAALIKRLSQRIWRWLTAFTRLIESGPIVGQPKDIRIAPIEPIA
jgi:hypothetical protein